MTKEEKSANRKKKLAKQKVYRETNKEKIRAWNKTYRETHKEEAKAYQEAYYEANREKKLAGQKVYRETHKEEISVRNKAYNEAHKEEIKAYCEVWYKANKEKVKTNSKTYYKANKGKRRAQNKVNYETHKEEYTARSVKRRALKIQAILPTTDDELIKKIYKQRAVTTEEHGEPYHVDHIIPLSIGGAHHQDNMRVITAKENWEKGDKYIPELGGVWADNKLARKNKKKYEAL